jgi:hypothetical protein
MGIGVPVAAGLLALASIRHREFRRDVVLLLVLLVVSLVPLAGLTTRWYLYIPSAFACILAARIVSESIGRGRAVKTAAAALTAILVLTCGASLLREGSIWRQASVLSERTLDELGAILEGSRGELFLVNVPSAYGPPGALGGKPIFAYHIERALESRVPPGIYRRPTVVNHLWLGASAPGMSAVAKTGAASYSITCDTRAHFSFHTADFVSGRVRPENVTINAPWGETRIIDDRRLVVTLESVGPRAIAFFDGASWKLFADR